VSTLESDRHSVGREIGRSADQDAGVREPIADLVASDRGALGTIREGIGHGKDRHIRKETAGASADADIAIFQIFQAKIKSPAEIGGKDRSRLGPNTAIGKCRINTRGDFHAMTEECDLLHAGQSEEIKLAFCRLIECFP